MSKKIIASLIGSVVLLVVGAIELHREYEKAELKECKAIILWRLKQSGANDLLRSPELDSTLQAYCIAVIKNQ